MELHQTGTATLPLQRLLTRSRDLGEERTEERPSVGRKPRTAAGRGLKEKVPERFNAQEDAFIEASERRRRLYRNLWIAGPCLIIAGLSALTGLQSARQNVRTAKRPPRSRLLGSYVEQGRQLLVEKDNERSGALRVAARPDPGFNQQPSRRICPGRPVGSGYDARPLIGRGTASLLRRIAPTARAS